MRCVALGVCALLVVLCSAESNKNAQQQMQMPPLGVPAMANPMFVNPAMLMGLMNQHMQQQAPLMGGLRGARPAAPDVTGKVQDMSNMQTESSITSMVESTLQSGLQSMSEMAHTAGLKAAQQTHNAFLPPYSWMWKLGTTVLGTKYRKVQMVSDLPELMNLISGYYANSPEAVKAAQQQMAAQPKFDLQSFVMNMVGM